MAESRLRARRGTRRSGTSPARAKAIAESGKKKSSRRSTLMEERLAVLPDLDYATPRKMLKRIIQTQPQVSPVVLQLSKPEVAEEAARAELPPKRVPSMEDLQLPDLPPEETSLTTFHVAKKKKKFSISEFERAADRRLLQSQAQSELDSSALARSLRVSLGSLISPDTVEKRGLLRRPKHHKPIDVEAFEAGVEQNLLKRKVQKSLGDSHSVSGIQPATLSRDAEIMLSNTELFVQPQFDEQSPKKLSAHEAQLADSKTAAQRRKSSAAAQQEARLVGLESSVGAKEGRTPRYSVNLIFDREHVDRRTGVSPKLPVKQQEEKQARSQQSNPMEQLSVSEEVMVGTAKHRASIGSSDHLEKKGSKAAQYAGVGRERAPAEAEGRAKGSVEHQGSPEAAGRIAKGIGAGSPGRHSLPFSSEKSGMKPSEEAVEEADVLEDQAIMVELDGPEEEPSEEEAEEPEGEEVSMRTPSFVRAAAYKLSTPRSAKPAAPKLSAPRPAAPKPPLRAKALPKGSGASRRKPREPELARSLVKQIFSHYVKMPVARETFRIVEKCSERYFKQLSNDLEAYTSHAGRKTVELSDLEVLMRSDGGGGTRGSSEGLGVQELSEEEGARRGACVQDKGW